MDNGRKEEAENRIEQMVKEVEKFTRTERHLENNSDIISHEQKVHAAEVQNERKRTIDNLKNKIVYGDDYKENEEENIIDNMISNDGYFRNNADNMSEEQINNLRENQKNRRDQLETFDK